MIIVTVLTVYLLGIFFAPHATRAVLKALSSMVLALGLVVLIFWRIFPGSGRTIGRL
jgi:hypothetical protein